MNKAFEQKRKSFIELGEIYFWTATINKWQPLLHTDDYKNVVISSLEYLSNMRKIDVFAFVIMPPSPGSCPHEPRTNLGGGGV